MGPYIARGDEGDTSKLKTRGFSIMFMAGEAGLLTNTVVLNMSVTTDIQ